MKRESKLQKAYQDDIRAKKFVISSLEEKLQECRSWEEIACIINRISSIEYKVECMKNRADLNNWYQPERIRTLRPRWDRCERVAQFTNTHK
jgi:hypothetical protein